VIRYGIVGFGLHAVRRLMPGFALARNSRVSALSRRDIDQARASAAEYNIPHAFDSGADLCVCPEVDAVLVATPNSCHLEDVRVALQFGKPVLCEKPMGMNASECQQMVEAARHANMLLGVAHVFRFDRSVERMRERIAAGQIGRPVLVRSEFFFPARNHARKWIHDAKIAGGGPIADVGVHCVDALRFILQDEIVRVAALAISDSGSGTVEAAAALSVEFASGTLGSILLSTRAAYRTPLEVVGERGTLGANNAFSVEVPVELELKQSGLITESETLSNTDAYARQVDMFSAALEGKSQFPALGEEGWQNQHVLDAAYRSLRSGNFESVPIVRK
jgi:predicted dehydrogenase